jgi:hypothetical protein
MLFGDIRKLQRCMMRESKKAQDACAKVTKDFENKLAKLLVGKKVLILPEEKEIIVAEVDHLYFQGDLPTFRVYSDGRKSFCDIGPEKKIKLAD